MLELTLQLSVIFTTWSKPEVHLHHTPYFHTEVRGVVLELFSILYCCYYSQNYSGIIISGLSADKLVSCNEGKCCGTENVYPLLTFESSNLERKDTLTIAWVSMLILSSVYAKQ